MPQTSLGGLRLLVILVFSISVSTYPGEDLASGWPWFLSLSLPLLLCLHIQFPPDMCTISVLCAWMFNSLGICAQVLCYVPTCSILSGYVHKFCVVLSNLYVVSCLYVQFSRDMCTNFAFWFARLFLGWKIYWGCRRTH